MPRPQFSLKTMLWLMAVVAAFLGGAAWQRAAAQKEQERLMLQLKSLGESNVTGYKKLRELSRVLKATEPEGSTKSNTTVTAPEHVAEPPSEE